MRLQKFVKLSDGKKLLGEIEGSLQEATKEVRTFTYLLHPPRLEDDGLSATLKEFAGGYSRLRALLRSCGSPPRSTIYPSSFSDRCCASCRRR